MNPLIDRSKNLFTNCKVVSADVDGETYQRQDAKRGDPEFVMSRSALLAFASCPAKWIAGWIPKETDATDWGDLMDCRILTPHRFPHKYVLQPETVTATKTMSIVKSGEAAVGDLVPWSPTSSEAKAWTAAQKATGKVIVTPEEHGESNFALSVLFKDERAAELINTSAKQVLVVGEYQDEATGLTIPIKGLIDLVPNSDSVHKCALADFKTARSAHPRTWVRTVDERGYDAQAAMFLDLYTTATGEDRNTFYHIIQENTHPFQVARRLLSAEFVELGRMKIHGALKKYAQCLKENRFPDWDQDSPYGGWSLVEPEAWMMTR